MTPNERAEIAKQRALALAVMVHDESPDSVAGWLRSLTDVDRIDLLIVLGAAMPSTTKGFEDAWAWTDPLDRGVDERQVMLARQRGFRDADIARALACRVEDLPPRIRVA